MKKGNNRSLLWKLVNEKGMVSYLFGTMHVKDYRAFIYQDVITHYIDKCNIFATEFDLRERHELKGNNFSNLPQGQDLVQLVGIRKYDRLKKMLYRSFSIDVEPLRNTLPLFIINILTEQILAKSRSVPLDTFLWQYAENNQRELRGVETFAEQLDTLSKIPLASQIKSLIEIGKHPKKFRRQIGGLMKLYISGDIVELHKRSKKSLGKQRKLLLYDRNKVMGSRILNLIDENSSFIAIGAGHLAGKKGVLRIIKNKGIILKPIRLDLL